MTGGEKRSLLKTKVEQAESYRPARPKSDGDEDGEMEEEEEEEAYAGPTALVHVKEAQSAWQAMRSRSFGRHSEPWSPPPNWPVKTA